METLIEAIPTALRILLVAATAAGFLCFGALHERAFKPVKKVSRLGIVDFELARTPARAHAILTQWGLPGREAARRAIWLDYGIIVCYSLLLSLATGWLALAAGQLVWDWVIRLGWWLAGLALAAGALDAFENWLLLRVLDDYQRGEGSSASIHRAKTVGAWAAASAKFAIVIVASLYVLVMLAVNLVNSRSEGRIAGSEARVEASTLFQVHMPDLKNGEAVLIDFGDKEILVDAGSQSDLREYLEASAVIDGPIELVVITHAHADSYGGLRRVLDKFQVLELWDGGFESTGSLYQKYLERARETIGTIRRPLVAWKEPVTATGRDEPFELESIPGVRFSILHIADPRSVQIRPQEVNNTSIVLRVEIAGVKILFPGDAQAKSNGVLPAAEAEIVAAESRLPGLLGAQILVAPHSGSNLASTQPFIDAVDPDFVLFSAQPRFGHPRESVLRRYEQPARRLLRTDRHKEPSLDHIVLAVRSDGQIRYQFLRSVDGALKWTGELNGKVLTTEQLDQIISCNDLRLEPGRPQRGHECGGFSPDILRGADLTGLSHAGLSLAEMDLTEATLRGAVVAGDMRGTILDKADLSHADLREVDFDQATFEHAALVNALLPKRLPGTPMAGADLTLAVLPGADLSGADLSQAVLDGAQLASFRMIGGTLSPKSMRSADLTSATLEADPGSLVPVEEMALADYLATLQYENSPHTLVSIREGLKTAGLREQERELTYAIERGKRLRAPWPERIFSYLFFELSCSYGAAPGRPLKILAGSFLLWVLAYYFVARFGRRSGLRLVVQRRRRHEPGKTRTSVRRVVPRQHWRALHGSRRLGGAAASEWRLLLTASEFSLRSAFNLKFKWFEAGTWLRLLHRREFELEPVGWARMISGLQSLISLYLVAIWLLSYFGRPFG